MSEQIEGRNPVREAIRAGRVRRLWVARGLKGKAAEALLAAARHEGVPVEFLSREELARRARTPHHQGVLAEVGERPAYGLEDLLERARRAGEPPLIVVAAEIQDPQNLGSLIRSAEAAGAHGLLLPRHRSAGLTATVAKASAGALEYLPVVQVPNLARALEELKEAGLWVCGAAPEAAQLYTQVDLTPPLAVVVGSEGRGIPRLVKERCDFLVRLPMRGRVGSLNAAVAGAILLYEVLRQRGQS